MESQVRLDKVLMILGLREYQITILEEQVHQLTQQLVVAQQERKPHEPST